jgi:hypothetical protein
VRGKAIDEASSSFQPATEIGFSPIELGRIDEGGVLIQARNALTLRNLYELRQ